MLLIVSGCANSKNNIVFDRKKSDADVQRRENNIEQNVQLKTSSYRRKYDTGDLKLNFSKKLYRFWIHYFTHRDKERFNRHLENADKYREVVVRILRKHGIPEDIFYLGLIESGYNTRVKSRASAAGPWQFIKPTAIRYGLIINKKIDERYNVFKSTDAAARYLKDLYKMFGNWELAICAYNKGENGLLRAIKKAKSLDYRTLVARRLLPRETIYYIPKIVAARELYENRERYGLNPIRESSILHNNYKAIRITRTISLERVAKKLDIDKLVLSMMNPDIKHGEIWGSSRRPFILYYPELPIKYRPMIDQKGSDKSSMGMYVVKKGDHLEGIAKKFGLTVRKLISFNSLRSDRIFPEQEIHIPL